jgi:hypothetical protein
MNYNRIGVSGSLFYPTVARQVRGLARLARSL